MVITWYGEGCFRLQNGDTSVLLDVYDSSTGLTPPRGKVDAHVRTLTSWPFPFGEQEETIIRGAGEYDIRGVHIKGFELPQESTSKFFKTVYIILWEDITIGVLGHLSEDLPPQVLENFEEIDILIGPGGGAPFIDQDRMARLLKQVTPKVFIPSFFKISGLKRSAGALTPLLERINGGAVEPQEKFVCKKKELDEIKKTTVVCLKI